ERKAEGEAAGDTTAANALPLPVQQPTAAAVQTAAATGGHFVARHVPVHRVGAEIAKAAEAGGDSIEISLDPVDLGRVDVRLEFGDKGEARAHLAVDRPETLELLTRDQRQIERSLRDAGFDARDGAVSMSLRQNGGDGNGQAQRQYQAFEQSRGAGGASRSNDADVGAAPVADVHRPRRDALVDLRL
ncbi:flagellar hook-length control protein FliK, partial [Oharaeibacter diazotrophicus]